MEPVKTPKAATRATFAFVPLLGQSSNLVKLKIKKAVQNYF